MSNTAHIGIATSRGAPVIGATHHGVLGRHITVRPQALQDFCASMLRDCEHDLVVVCGAVAFADRLIPRRRGSGWPRDLKVTVPVTALDVWRSSRVYGALVDALEYVTGDNWEFEFVAGGEKVTVGQGAFGLDQGPYAIVPFSDGMDSFLQWRLLAVEEPDIVPLRLQTSTRSLNRERNSRIEDASDARDRKLQLPVCFKVGRHAEPSYRTRTFLFFSMAGLAAAKLGARRVVVGENGVGALGSSLIQYGNECPHRTTHPAFTRRLAVFLSALLETELVFEHPQVLRTKGEVLSRAIDLGITGWENTNSCVRDSRQNLGGMPCGVCSGCMLRRTALVAVGQEPSGYFWERLSSPTLDGSRTDIRGREAEDNDREILRHAMHSMDELARLAELDAGSEVFLRGSWELTGPIPEGPARMARELHRLVCVYAREWTAFRDSFGDARLLNLETAS